MTPQQLCHCVGESHVKEGCRFCNISQPGTRKERDIRLRALLVEPVLRPASELPGQVAPSSSASVRSARLPPAPFAMAMAKKENQKAQLPGTEQSDPRGRWPGDLGLAARLLRSHTIVPPRLGPPAPSKGPTPRPAPSSSLAPQAQDGQRSPPAPMTPLVPQDSAKVP